MFAKLGVVLFATIAVGGCASGGQPDVNPSATRPSSPDIVANVILNALSSVKAQFGSSYSEKARVCGIPDQLIAETMDYVDSQAESWAGGTLSQLGREAEVAAAVTADLTQWCDTP